MNHAAIEDVKATLEAAIEAIDSWVFVKSMHDLPATSLDAMRVHRLSSLSERLRQDITALFPTN